MSADTVLRSRAEATERLADKLEKPLLDNRSYRVIRLPNKLEVLLIHDPDTDKASAAMDVNVGSLSDPEDLQGVAHAVEHLLFMGTEKYPGENDYNAYLTKYGGHSNAFTAGTSTNYYFELSSTSTSNSPSNSATSSQASLLVPKDEAPLYGALDRFAQFFVNPLFREDCLERELKAVDSENKKNLQSDNWRMMQLAKSTTAKEHPYHLFSTGNYQTLHDEPLARGVKIRDEFINFYQKHYTANRMKLVILGRETLDELQSWAEELFSGVVNKDLPQLRWDDVPVLTEKEYCTQTFVKPIMDRRMLDLSWTYPDEEDLYESQPGRYLGHLLGHEGPGSILAYLKAKGWVTELSAGASGLCPGTAFFSVGMGLTTEGLAHYREIVKTVFQYIAMIKEEGPKEWIHDENAKLTEIEFKFKQKGPAASTTSSMGGIMQKPLPRNWLLSGQSLVRKYNPEGIQRGMDSLRVDNFRFTLSAQDLKSPEGDFDKREKWYDTEYKLEKIPRDFLDELKAVEKQSKSERPAELHLPAKNEFIPQRLDVEKKEVPSPAVTPKLIRNDANVRVWWKKDDQFWVPKANVYIFLRSPIGYTSPYTTVLTSLFKELVEDSLTEYAYDAELAGLGYNILRVPAAFQVGFGGYNDKMHVLVEKVLSSMRDLQFTDERFAIIKDRLARSYRNQDFMDPFRQINRYTQWLIKDRMWPSHEQSEELPSITADDLRGFIPQLLRQMHIEVFAHGNLYKEDALRLADLAEKIMHPQALPVNQWEQNRTVELAQGTEYVYKKQLKNPDNVNHCLEYTMYVGSMADRSKRGKLLLLDQMMNEPVFDTLRTKEQLGYIVGGGFMVLFNQGAFRILIQSERDCDYTQKRADAFLTEYETTIRDMSAKEFESHKIGIINRRLEKLKNLREESGRLWHHVISEQYDFELVYRDVESIEPLTKEDILEFYAQYFRPGSATRSTLAIHLVAQKSAEDVAAETTDDQKIEKLTDKIIELLGQIGLQPEADDRKTLGQELEKAGAASGDVKAISSALGNALRAGGLDEESIKLVLTQGEAVLPSLLPTAGIVAPAAKEAETNGVNGHTETNGVSDEKSKVKRVLIEDVKAWKAGLPLTTAAQAVKDVTEFEELEPKL